MSFYEVIQDIILPFFPADYFVSRAELLDLLVSVAVIMSIVLLFRALIWVGSGLWGKK